MTMAGKAAEVLKYGEDNVSNGPAGDIQQASALARAMVLRWGMSDKLGPLLYEETQEGYLGYGGSQRTMQSADPNTLIDTEIRDLVEGAHKRATDILKTHEDKLHLLANALLEYETLTGDEIRKVIAGQKLHGDDDKPSTGGGTTSVLSIPKTRGKAAKAGLEPSA